MAIARTANERVARLRLQNARNEGALVLSHGRHWGSRLDRRSGSPRGQPKSAAEGGPRRERTCRLKTVLRRATRRRQHLLRRALEAPHAGHRLEQDRAERQEDGTLALELIMLRAEASQ